MNAQIVPSARNEFAAAQRKEFRAAFLSVAPAMFLGSLDQTIIAAALPVVARSFGGLRYVTWIVTAYLLTATIAAPIYGRLGDAYGRRKMLLWSLAFFFAGSLVCTAAASLPLLVAGRCLQGFGGGGLMTLARALIGEVVVAQGARPFSGLVRSGVRARKHHRPSRRRLYGAVYRLALYLLDQPSIECAGRNDRAAPETSERYRQLQDRLQRDASLRSGDIELVACAQSWWPSTRLDVRSIARSCDLICCMLRPTLGG